MKFLKFIVVCVFAPILLGIIVSGSISSRNNNTILNSIMESQIEYHETSLKLQKEHYSVCQQYSHERIVQNQQILSFCEDLLGNQLYLLSDVIKREEGDDCFDYWYDSDLEEFDNLGYEWYTPEHEELIKAIFMVESGGDVNAVGDDGNALGGFQIWKSYWKDAVEHTPSIGGEYENVVDPAYSILIILSYWDRYGSRVNYDLEGLAKQHNGGPSGHTKQATEKYWNKVKEYM